MPHDGHSTLKRGGVKLNADDKAPKYQTQLLFSIPVNILSRTAIFHPLLTSKDIALQPLHKLGPSDLVLDNIPLWEISGLARHNEYIRLIGAASDRSQYVWRSEK